MQPIRLFTSANTGGGKHPPLKGAEITSPEAMCADNALSQRRSDISIDVDTRKGIESTILEKIQI